MVSRSALGQNALVIVESPTKARTIRGFLPDGFTVAASMGHVRDLPGDAKEIPAKYKGEEWARFGVNVEADFAPLYIVPGDKKSVVRELKELLKDADVLYLATDEDREGESISWHLLELLQPKVPVKRMVFHEITREAIQHALGATRDVDHDLVHAQETRRILDRLVGYTLSPLLWKKVAFGLSAGRVQSVATRLIVDRERERLAFRIGSYWDLKADLEQQQAPFEAALLSLGGKRLAVGKDFDEQTGQIADGKDVILLGEKEARALVDRLGKAPWRVISVDETPRTLKPYAPFTTSTLQQEANRKLRFGAKRTMQIAQKLYENGHITYMRTDSTAMSEQAVKAARALVKQLYGEAYLPSAPRTYANKVANAQEAHEAIRPAGSIFKTPDQTGLHGEQFALYDLIWKRTVASQMKDAKKTGTTVELEVLDAIFKATGQRTDFPGFLRAYVEGSDDPDAAIEDRDSPLPPLAVGDTPTCTGLEPVGHETKPPARYTEASLVKALEENGVGRPSTYASIIGTIQDRGYVVRAGQALVPTFTAFAVTDLLILHFGNLVDVTFTKAMEQRLDEIAEGASDWVGYLREFYLGDSGLQALTARGEEEIKPAEARVVALDGLGAAIRIGRFGPYAEREENGEVVRASLPKDATPADLTPERIDSLIRQRAEGPESIGTHPETAEPIYLMDGQYGPYVQLGEGDGKKKPKRSSLPKGVKPEDVTLELAVGLLSLPRVLGQHPETNTAVKAGLGRFGPFVVHAKGGAEGKDDFRSLKATDDVLTVTLERALELLKEPKGVRGQRAAATPVRTIGAHPKDGEPVNLFDGRYGPYVKHGELNASVPRGVDPATFSLDAAVRLIEEKGKPPKGKRRGAAKSTAKKSAKKSTKNTSKKSTTKKTTKATTTKRTVKKAAKKSAPQSES